jgi:hypothetical protein
MGYNMEQDKNIGKIFKYRNSYWKIIGEPYGVVGNLYHGSYPVIKCNKNGLEFSDQNGFSIDMIKKMELFDSKLKGKVSQINIDNGLKKREYNRLKEKLEYIQTRLLVLEKEIKW